MTGLPEGDPRHAQAVEGTISVAILREWIEQRHADARVMRRVGGALGETDRAWGIDQAANTLSNLLDAQGVVLVEVATDLPRPGEYVSIAANQRVKREDEAVEAATKPCEKCGGTGEESRVVACCCRRFLPDGQCCGNAIPAEERNPCPACGGSGSVPVALVDRDALVGEIAAWLREQASRAHYEVAGHLRMVAAGIEARFAPGNREGQ